MIDKSGDGVTQIDDEKWMENLLDDCLAYLNIRDAVWMRSKNGHYHHVYFTCVLDQNDQVIHYLKSRGIGSKRSSTLGYIPFGLFYYNEIFDPTDLDQFNVHYFNEIKNNFLKSVTSRLTVAQVVEGVRNGTTITFDWYMYLVWSSAIAAMGILSSAPVDIAASMMIEPLMNAVMAISFGLAIHNLEMIAAGLRSLIIGLLFCLAFGYAFGMIFLIWRSTWNPPPAGVWPTPEMSGRGEYRTLIYGAVIAIAGGAILGVILLKNNLVALTGVAVATTFMPPFVNGGLCLALATHLQLAGSGESYQNLTIEGTQYQLKPAWSPPSGYSVRYAVDMRVECGALAAVSLAYTLVNVFCLLVGSFLTLKIKEIVPIRRIASPSDYKFFAEDIKIYRAYRKRFPDSRSPPIGRQILEEWADISGLNKRQLLRDDDPAAAATQLQTLQDIASDVEADANYQIITQHAFANKYQPHLRRRLTQPQLRNTNSPLQNSSNNNNNNRNSEPFSVDAAITTGTRLSARYGSMRRSFQNSINNNVADNLPYSVWPSSNAQMRSSRSRSSSTVSAMIYEQINNNNNNNYNYNPGTKL